MGVGVNNIQKKTKTEKKFPGISTSNKKKKKKAEPNFKDATSYPSACLRLNIALSVWKSIFIICKTQKKTKTNISTM